MITWILPGYYLDITWILPGCVSDVTCVTNILDYDVKEAETSRGMALRQGRAKWEEQEHWGAGSGGGGHV